MAIRLLTGSQFISYRIGDMVELLNINDEPNSSV